MGPQAMRPPNALHRTDADAGRLCHRRRSPVRCLAGRIASRERDNALDHRGRQRWLAGAARLVAQEPVHTLQHETLLPAPHAGLILAGLALDAGRPDPVGGQQNDPCPPNVLLRAVAIRDDRLETDTVVGINGDGDSLAHPAASHIRRAAGIRYRSLLSDQIH
jgi:hypothetical protein